MATLTSIVSHRPDFPETPAQTFFDTYRQAVDDGKFNSHGQCALYYAPDVVFHNSNGSTYHGLEDLWNWLKDLLSPFEKVHHAFHHCVEIANPPGRSSGDVMMQMRLQRQIWMKGNVAEKPDVVVPLGWHALVGPIAAHSGQGASGLRMKEVWLFWDTGPLMKHTQNDTVASRTTSK